MTYRISGIDSGSIENYMKNAKNTVEKIMSSITMTNYKIQLILWTEWFINDNAIINPQNSDNECFKWAVIAAVYSVDNPYRVNNLRA